jgi:glycosyltransferase involved in cell wall biosynthesis
MSLEDPHADATRAAIVLTCYNAAETVADTVSSVRSEPAELVIVDDGSTEPETLDLLAGFERQGLAVVHRPNGGLSEALMTGVEATSSPYILRFDADDLLEPGAVEALADALDANPDAAAAWGDLKTFGLTSFRVPSVPVLDPWFVTYASVLPASSMFRRSALLEVGGWQGRGKYEDWDVWMALAEHGYPGVYIPRVIYHYRREAEGLLFDSLARFEELYEDLRHRHAGLFANRMANRARSAAPLPLKTLLPFVERVPGLSRLRKVWLAQLAAHLFWNGGVSATWRIVREGISSRRRSQRRS